MMMMMVMRWLPSLHLGLHIALISHCLELGGHNDGNDDDDDDDDNDDDNDDDDDPDDDDNDDDDDVFSKRQKSWWIGLSNPLHASSTRHLNLCFLFSFV